MINRLIFLTISLWLGATLLIDFIIVPTIFQTIENFFNAGELGIALFGRFNLIEGFLSVSLISLALKRGRENRFFVPQISISAIMMLIVLTYISYLTPKLTELTALWKEADAANQIAIAGISDIQQEHQFFHRIYVTLDSLKMMLLSALLILELRFSEGAVGKA